jgi:hypothetical protein
MNGASAASHRADECFSAGFWRAQACHPQWLACSCWFRPSTFAMEVDLWPLFPKSRTRALVSKRATDGRPHGVVPRLACSQGPSGCSGPRYNRRRAPKETRSWNSRPSLCSSNGNSTSGPGPSSAEPAAALDAWPGTEQPFNVSTIPSTATNIFTNWIETPAPAWAPSRYPKTRSTCRR